MPAIARQSSKCTIYFIITHDFQERSVRVVLGGSDEPLDIRHRNLQILRCIDSSSPMAEFLKKATLLPWFAGSISLLSVPLAIYVDQSVANSALAWISKNCSSASHWSEQTLTLRNKVLSFGCRRLTAVQQYLEGIDSGHRTWQSLLHMLQSQYHHVAWRFSEIY